MVGPRASHHPQWNEGSSNSIRSSPHSAKTSLVRRTFTRTSRRCRTALSPVLPVLGNRWLFMRLSLPLLLPKWAEPTTLHYDRSEARGAHRIQRHSASSYTSHHRPEKAIFSLKWAAKEMERRYNILEANHVRDIDSIILLFSSRQRRQVPKRAAKRPSRATAHRAV